MQGIYLENIIGQKYEKLTIIDELQPIKTPTRGNRRIVLCRCDCGNTIETRLDYLRNGHRKSCGCLYRNQNGFGSTKICKVWRQMHDRCENVKNRAFQNYGGRGIKVCTEWSGKNGFENFRLWAISHGYKEGLTIDRIDVNGDYCPENCRWATVKQQNNNQRDNHKLTYDNQTHTIAEWSDITGISQSLILARINKLNYSVGEALGYVPHVIKNGKARKVNQIDRTTNELIAQFDSLIEAQKATNLHFSAISKCCQGKSKQAGGYIWQYA